VEVQLLNSQEAVADFYRLNCITRRDRGLPPQPRMFFEKIFEYIIAVRKGFVALAVHSGEPIAGAVYFHYRDEGIYKYGASNRDYQHLRANNLIMWEAIQWHCQNGIRDFSFGRTEPGNVGLLQFKRSWGAKEDSVSYYKMNLRENAFSAKRNGTGSSYTVFKILPIPVLKLAGRMLYKHVG
jgi:CelD/BcsL family acetyltransferase involved in cellulose biosynthesis